MKEWIYHTIYSVTIKIIVTVVGIIMLAISTTFHHLKSHQVHHYSSSTKATDMRGKKNQDSSILAREAVFI